MKKIILKEMSYVSNGTTRTKVYENDYYKITEKRYELIISLTIEPKERFVPSIKVNFDDNELFIMDFTIDTAAYGFAKKECVEKIIEGYQAALLVVEQLEEMYIEEEN